MRNGLQKYLLVLLVLALSGISALGQGGSLGSISGTVLDPKGAVVPGATVVVKNAATNQENTVQTSNDGAFNVPALTAGNYTATVTAGGFKQAVVTEIKVDVGKPTSVNIGLEIGSANETVTVVGGGELLQTQSATVGTTLVGRQITDLPTASRDALDLVLALPGTTTVGRPRTSSVNGLPKGALNISMDGVNVQDNLLKSNDGFFTYIRPRTDAISEVTVSTTTPGSESSSEGAVQIKFVTQGGSNEYHGGVYWYHRNPALNANYWFSNRDSAPDPVTLKAPQARILLNQPGGKVGGPISIPKLFSGKDKAFFFVNYEEYRLPEKTFRTRSILSPQAQSGIFRYTAAPTAAVPANTTCVPNPANPAQNLCSLNVFTFAQNANLPFANTDPTVGGLLNQIRTSVAGFNIVSTGDPNIQQVSFNNTGGQVRKFPTVRLDFNLTKNHHVENIWNYQSFGGGVDFLNSVDPAFPGFPNHGSQGSIRWSNVSAWRWTINQNMVNEARFGLTGGTVLFFADVNPAQFTNQGGYNLGIGQAGITSATVTNAPSRRNSPVKQFSDTLSWVRGNHSLNFGFNFTRVNYWNQAVTPVQSAAFVPSSSLDLPGWNAFSALSGVSQQQGAANLYYVLSGRLSAVNSNARLNEETLKYSFLGDLISRAQSSEMGIYGQDTWRIRPNLTLTLGLRLERAIPVQAENDTFAGVSYSEIYGESGLNNYTPGCSNGVTCGVGAVPGPHSNFTLFGKGTRSYEQEFGTFLPSFGLVYSPNFQSGFMTRLMGQPGQTVFRLGFSMASVREGTGVFTAVVGGNPGGTITTNRSLALNNLAVGTYLRQGPFAPGTFNATPVYPNNGLLTDGVNAFKPDLKTGYVESWTVGIQRELDSNNVIELRYIGNRGHRLWRQYDLNGQLNVRNNGLLEEFSKAQSNLFANIAAGRGVQFRYQGPNTGTVPLPILFGYFQAVNPANAGVCTNLIPNDPGNCNTAYNSANFASTTFTSLLNTLNPNVLGLAAQLSSTAFDNRRTATGADCFLLPFCGQPNANSPGAKGFGLFPYNMFLINPGKRGGAFVVDNGGQTYYDAFTFEYRRRMSAGLLLQGSYTFGKALANTYASSSSVFDQPNDLLNPKLRKGEAPFNITHGVKMNFIYELPFGQGQRWGSGLHGWGQRILGGWGVNGNIRIQSGSPFSLGNVQLVGMTREELQEAVGVYRDLDANGANTGQVYVLPLDIRQNTWRANNIALSTAGVPTFTQGAPTGRFIAPASFGNCKQAFSGQCGFANLVLHGPSFFRTDASVVKRIKFTERTNLELRGEFLNAFNNINFLVGGAGNDLNTLAGLNATTFGRFTAAYQDLSTTNDPGGRLVQLVVRFNF